MKADLRWLLRLGAEQKMFTAEQGRTLLAKLGGSPDLMTFAQGLIDSGVVTALEKLEELAGEAITRAADGPPQETAPKPAAPVRESVPSAGLAFEMLGALDDAALAAPPEQRRVPLRRHVGFLVKVVKRTTIPKPPLNSKIFTIAIQCDGVGFIGL